MIDIVFRGWLVERLGSRRKTPMNLKAPCIRRLWADPAKLRKDGVYPFS